MLPQPSNIRAI